jgi:hypothetical protein
MVTMQASLVDVIQMIAVRSDWRTDCIMHSAWSHQKAKKTGPDDS